MLRLISDLNINDEVKTWLISQKKWTPKAFAKYNVKSGTYDGNKCIIIPVADFFRVYLLPSPPETKGTWRSYPKGSGLLGNFNFEHVFLCEGEWDLFSLFENDLHNAVTTTTGANGFKETFANSFSGKSVNIVYDNDSAGRTGAQKAAERLLGVCESVSIINLPNELGEGGDVRDYFNSGGTKSGFLSIPSVLFKKESEYKSIVDRYPIGIAPKPVQELIKIISAHTDAPEQFIAGAGLSVLSTVLGNSFTVLNGIHLNDYYLFVGKSGLSRKSTAQSIAEKIVHKIITLHSHPYSAPQKNEVIQVSPFECISNFSVEGLEEALKGRGISLLITPGEYRQVLEVAKRQGQGNTIPQLTSMWDLKPISFRSRTTTLKATDYCLTMLATSTKDWLSNWLEASNVHGGFINRHNVIVADPIENVLVFPAALDDSEWDHIVSIFNSLIPNKRFEKDVSPICWHGTKTRIDFNDSGAKDFWRQYTLDKHEQMKKMTDDQVDMTAREPIHAIKLAGLKCVSENRRGISSEDLLFGTNWAEASSYAIKKLCENSEKEHHSLSQVEERLLAFFNRQKIQDKSSITKSDIGKHFGGEQTPYKKALIDLEQKGAIIAVNGRYALAPEKPKESSDLI